jgi:hypothetical protein
MYSLARSTVNQYDHRSHVCTVRSTKISTRDRTHARANTTTRHTSVRSQGSCHVSTSYMLSQEPKDRTWTGVRTHTCAPQPIGARRSNINHESMDTRHKHRQREEQTWKRPRTRCYIHGPHTHDTDRLRHDLHTTILLNLKLACMYCVPQLALLLACGLTQSANPLRPQSTHSTNPLRAASDRLALTALAWLPYVCQPAL